MSGRRYLTRLMQDLTGLTERRHTITLAILLIAILLVPSLPGAAQIGRGEAAPPPVPAATPTPTPTPTPEPTEDPSSDDVLSGVMDRLDGMGEDEAPADGPTAAPSDPASDPAVVEAEGDDAEEVVAPTAPPADQPVEGEVPVEGEGAVDGEQPGIEPPPITSYGVSVVPSLGSAARPLTNPLSNDPLVMAPMVAGQEVAPNGQGSAVAEAAAAIAPVADPVSNVAAASLSIIQPSWFATTMAMLVLLVAAAYGALLRRRGEQVPEALAFTGAVRPGDQRAHARSVRPADMAAGVRSIRP